MAELTKQQVEIAYNNAFDWIPEDQRQNKDAFVSHWTGKGDTELRDKLRGDTQAGGVYKDYRDSWQSPEGSVYLDDPGQLGKLTETDLIRQPGSDRIHVSGLTYIDDPAKLKNYTEDQIIRTGGKIYLKPGVQPAPTQATAPQPAVDSGQARDVVKQQETAKDIKETEDAQKKAEDSEKFEMTWAKDIPGMPELPSDPYPQAPDLVDLYKSLRQSQGMAELEANLNDKLSELSAFEDAYDQGKYDIGQKLTSMSLVRGEQAELQEQYIRQKNAKTRVIDALQRSLDSKNATVAIMMDLTQKNFDNARASYNDQFDNAMAFQQQWYTQFADQRDYARLVSNDVKDRDFQERELQRTIDNQMRDEARANLSVLVDSMISSNKGWDDISQEQKNAISKMEQQAGLPPGSMQAFGSAKPQANLLGTVNGVDKDGNDIVTFMYADKDGNPGMMVTKKTGGFTDQSSGGGGGDSYDTDKPISKMSKSELNADYQLSLNGLGQVIEVTAGDGGILTRGQAIDQLFDHYEGRIPKEDIADDVYRNYEATPGEYQKQQDKIS